MIDRVIAGKRVMLTGHTGFKGTWFSVILSLLGAEVYGYSLNPDDANSLFFNIQCDKIIHSEIGDIRDLEHLKSYFRKVQPEYVFHLAAQPIVRESYRNPHYTYETNVMGTVNVCECIRKSDSVKSFLNVTTDKVYQNHEWEWGYRETDPLDGYDPYSNSKSCSELVTHSYASSFLKAKGIAVSTARAGNVIGGGDFAKDRIIPDCFRAASEGREILLRNPHSTRPFQHVLEPLFAYLMIAQRQVEDGALAGSYNVGPDDRDCVTVEELVGYFCRAWCGNVSFRVQGDGGPHEASFLKLDCSKLKSRMGWRPCWNIEQAVEKSVEWYRLYDQLMKRGGNSEEMAKALRNLMRDQIEEYMRRA